MDWEAEWISTAEKLVRNKFQHSYMSVKITDDQEDMEDNSSECMNTKMNIFDSLPVLAPPKPSDLGSELDHYLSTNVGHGTDAITWWHKCHHIYLSLLHMVLDYLTIPGKYFLLSFSYCTDDHCDV